MADNSVLTSTNSSSSSQKEALSEGVSAGATDTEQRLLNLLNDALLSRERDNAVKDAIIREKDLSLFEMMRQNNDLFNAHIQDLRQSIYDLHAKLDQHWKRMHCDKNHDSSNNKKGN